MSTIERAYALARSGRFQNLAAVKRQLEADGCRAIEALLAPYSIKSHLQAICAATYRPAANAEAEALAS